MEDIVTMDNIAQCPQTKRLHAIGARTAETIVQFLTAVFAARLLAPLHWTKQQSLYAQMEKALLKQERIQFIDIVTTTENMISRRFIFIM